MKKNLAIVALSVIVIFALIVPVFAAGPTFKVEETVNKIYGVGKTKEITFVFAVKDFVGFPYNGGQNGVNALKAVLEYDDNVFYPIEINLTAQGNYNGIKTLTSKNEKAIETMKSWSGLVYNPDGQGNKPAKSLVIEASNFVNKYEEILKVTLKVKPTAPLGQTTVKLKDITASDQKMDIATAEVSQSVEITDSAGDATDPDHENGFGGYVRILPDMTVADFVSLKANFSGFKTEQQTPLKGTDRISTGTTATDGTYSYTLIAVGDIDSDGLASTTDVSQMKAFEIGLLTTLSENQRRAADIKWDAKCTVTDRAQLKMILVSLGDPKITKWEGQGNPTCKPITRK